MFPLAGVMVIKLPAEKRVLEVNGETNSTFCNNGQRFLEHT